MSARWSRARSRCRWLRRPRQARVPGQRSQNAPKNTKGRKCADYRQAIADKMWVCDGPDLPIWTRETPHGNPAYGNAAGRRCMAMTMPARRIHRSGESCSRSAWGHAGTKGKGHPPPDDMTALGRWEGHRGTADRRERHRLDAARTRAPVAGSGRPGTGPCTWTTAGSVTGPGADTATSAADTAGPYAGSVSGPGPGAKTTGARPRSGPLTSPTAAHRVRGFRRATAPSGREAAGAPRGELLVCVRQASARGAPLGSGPGRNAAAAVRRRGRLPHGAPLPARRAARSGGSARVALGYAEDSEWRNRDGFPRGRDEMVSTS